MNVNIKLLNENAVVPSYAKPGDAGMDLTAISYVYDKEKDYHVYGTGVAIEIPQGYVGLVFPRSSNRNTTAYLTNSVGVIDSGYRGEIMFTYRNRDKEDNNPPYNVGDRIGQIIILPYPAINFVKVDTLSDSERGTNGHGSTGN